MQLNWFLQYKQEIAELKGASGDIRLEGSHLEPSRFCKLKFYPRL